MKTLIRTLSMLLMIIMCILCLFNTEYKIYAEKKDNETKDKIEKKTENGPEITAEAAVLMEGSTGKILYQKNEEKKLRPASITKIMTLLLIFEAIDEGNLKLTDLISVSEHAASMGGSQVFLEAGEEQDVETLIKCICIASANDGSVAMAEHIAGSEEAFVSKMNLKAKELGMINTNFVNCYGLDTDNHYTSAHDVAIMSRELIVNHPEISKYTTVWMDTFTHTTRKGESEFGLNNTNKLIRSYKGITGLKTGSTGLAKYCLSATARRDGMDLIAVVMAAPDTKIRFKEAASLLNHGYANCKLYTDEINKNLLTPVDVIGGSTETLEVKQEKSFSYVFTNNEDTALIKREIIINNQITAPVKKGEPVGHAEYYYKNNKIGVINIVSVEDVEKASFTDYLKKLIIRIVG